MFVSRTLIVLVFAAAAVVPASSPAHAGMPPDGAAIGDFKTFGSGCVKDSTKLDTGGGVFGFSVTYDPDRFTAAAGGTSGPLDGRKNCQLVIDLKIPVGYTVAVSEMSSYRYAALPVGASAELRYRVGWGTTTTPWTTESLNGPYDNYWSSRNTFSAPAYAPCGGTLPLVVDTDLRVRPGADRRQAAWATFQTGRNSSAMFQLDWQPCV